MSQYRFAGLIVAAVLLVSCGSLRNYDDPEGPKFEGSYADQQTGFDGELKTVTWNISFGEEIEQAILELEGNEALNGADILLLQEMDSKE